MDEAKCDQFLSAAQNEEIIKVAKEVLILQLLSTFTFLELVN